jgi:hypothetical protein
MICVSTLNVKTRTSLRFPAKRMDRWAAQSPMRARAFNSMTQRRGGAEGSGAGPFRGARPSR